MSKSQWFAVLFDQRFLGCPDLDLFWSRIGRWSH